MADAEETNDREQAPAEKEYIAKRVTGTVKWFNVKNGYGFINRNDSKEDVFVHQSAIVKNNPNKYLRSVGDGEIVEFDVVIGDKGNEACNVTGPEGAPVHGSKYAADRNRRGYRPWYPRRGGSRGRGGMRSSQYDGRSQDRSEDEDNDGEPSERPRGRGRGRGRRPFWRPRYYGGGGPSRGRPYRGRGRGSRPVSNGYNDEDGDDSQGYDDQRTSGSRGGRRYFPRYYRPTRYQPRDANGDEDESHGGGERGGPGPRRGGGRGRRGGRGGGRGQGRNQDSGGGQIESDMAGLSLNNEHDD